MKCRNVLFIGLYRGWVMEGYKVHAIVKWDKEKVLS